MVKSMKMKVVLVFENRREGPFHNVIHESAPVKDPELQKS